MMKRLFCILGSTLLAASFTACTSNIRPLIPVQRQQVLVHEDGTTEVLSTQEATTQPATTQTATAEAAATQAAETQPAATQVAATEPTTEPAATRPGKVIVRVIDPNQATRFIYKASYNNIWQQATWLFHKYGFTLDRQDYRLGVMTTQPLPSAQFMLLWKPELNNANDAFENTLNSQRRSVRLTISEVPGKPDFYQIGVQVLVERQTNPTEGIGGPIFVEGSGFGRNAITLRSDYLDLKDVKPRWILMGHDPDLEKKLLDALFQRL